MSNKEECPISPEELKANEYIADLEGLVYMLLEEMEMQASQTKNKVNLVRALLLEKRLNKAGIKVL